MYEGFHRAYNVHALHSLIKQVDFPDHALAVDTDERHSSVNGVVRYPHIFKPVMQNSAALKGHENAQVDLNSEPVNVESFGKDFYLGNPVEGI